VNEPRYCPPFCQPGLRSGPPSPIRSRIYLVHVGCMLHTPVNPRCSPVGGSRCRAKRRVSRVSSANNLKLNLTGLSTPALYSTKRHVLVLPLGLSRSPLALLRLLRLVISARGVPDLAAGVTLRRDVTLFSSGRSAELCHEICTEQLIRGGHFAQAPHISDRK